MALYTFIAVQKNSPSDLVILSPPMKSLSMSMPEKYLGFSEQTVQEKQLP